MGRGKSKFAILESDIRKAMEHTISNGQAARYLGVTLKTYKKYATQYFDGDIKPTLFALFSLHAFLK